MIDQATRLARLEPPKGRVRVFLDTDTYNEVDDQFALAHLMLSPDRAEVVGIGAAPFHNERSEGPEDGMLKSLDEIHRVFSHLPVAKPPVFAGSRRWMGSTETPVDSDAAQAIIELSRKDEPLYVVAIGAPTNVASALVMDPTLADRMTLVWLGGHGLTWPHCWEFNLQQDMVSSEHLFESGVPLVLVPCCPMASHLLVTIPELEAVLRGASPIGDYFVDMMHGYQRFGPGQAKELWDLAAVAWVIDPEWVPAGIHPTPHLLNPPAWDLSRPSGRPPMAVVRWVQRNALMGDLYAKLQAAKR